MLHKLSELKEGDKIQHYECGRIVDAVVTKVKPNGVETSFEPFTHGGETYKTGHVIKSTPLQAKYHNAVTPAAWKDGQPITLNGTVPNYTKL